MNMVYHKINKYGTEVQCKEIDLNIAIKIKIKMFVFKVLFPIFHLRNNTTEIETCGQHLTFI